MQKYKIQVRDFPTKPFYIVEVKGELVTIKGFEEARLFVHEKFMGEFEKSLGNCWRISEVTTGLWLSESFISPQQAIRNCTRLLKRAGIEKFREKRTQKQMALKKENDE